MLESYIRKYLIPYCNQIVFENMYVALSGIEEMCVCRDLNKHPWGIGVHAHSSRGSRASKGGKPSGNMNRNRK